MALIWKEQYDKLVKFQRANGNCDLPPGPEWKKLRQWMLQQKDARFGWSTIGESLTTSQTNKLDALGIDWDNLEDVDSFVRRDTTEIDQSSDSTTADETSDDDSDCSSDNYDESTIVASNTSPSHNESPRLNHRTLTSMVTPSEDSKTDGSFRAITGFEHFFKLLQFFHQNFQHCDVPDTVEWIELSNWLYCKKKSRDRPFKGHPQLTKNQIDRMEALGVTWKVVDNDLMNSKVPGFSCNIKLIQDALIMTDVGYISLPSQATFVDARRKIMNSVSFPQWFPEDADWSFYIPTHGPLTAVEEVSVGPMYTVLKTLGPCPWFCAPFDTEVLVGFSPTDPRRRFA